MTREEDREMAKIKNFLAKDIAEFKVKRQAKRLITTLGEIAEHTGLDVRTVRKWLSRVAGRKVDGKVVVVRVGKTDVVVRLAK